MFPKPISGNSIDTDSRVADVFGKSLVNKSSSDEFWLESSEDAGEAGVDDDDDDDDDDSGDIGVDLSPFKAWVNS